MECSVPDASGEAVFVGRPRALALRPSFHPIGWRQRVRRARAAKPPHAV